VSISNNTGAIAPEKDIIDCFFIKKSTKQTTYGKSARKRNSNH
jgi:hypothetical protein